VAALRRLTFGLGHQPRGVNSALVAQWWRFGGRERWLCVLTGGELAVWGASLRKGNCARLRANGGAHKPETVCGQCTECARLQQQRATRNTLGLPVCCPKEQPNTIA